MTTDTQRKFCGVPLVGLVTLNLPERLSWDPCGLQSRLGQAISYGVFGIGPWVPPAIQ